MKRMILTLLALVAAAVFAQAKVVHLNNGNTVNGELVGETSTTVTLKLANGSERTFNKVEILKMEDSDTMVAPPVKKEKYADYSKNQHGFWGAADLGLGWNPNINPDLDSSFPIELLLTIGYRFNKYIMIGAGGGFRYYIGCNSDRVEVKDGEIYEQGHWAFPVYFNARGIFFNDESRSAVPFWSANVGYTFFDGFYCSPTIGCRFGSTVRHHFLLGLSYTAQQTKLRGGGGPTDFSDGYVHTVSLKFGYEF